MNSRPRFTTQLNLPIGAAIALTLLGSSCALVTDAKSKSVVKECVLPAEQSGTLAGKWSFEPIPIAFRNGHFSNDEMVAIAKAADIWNDFFDKSHGLKILDYGDTSAFSISNANPAPAICKTTASIVGTAGFQGKVVIYKRSSWPYPSKPDAIALTSFCPQVVSGASVKVITNAIMETNHQNFFVAGKPQPDLVTIFVHEFGHLLGLAHSCELTSTTGSPQCCDPSGKNGLPVCGGGGSLDATILDAVMFPVVYFNQGVGEVRQELNDNDEGRANCLYTSGT